MQLKWPREACQLTGNVEKFETCAICTGFIFCKLPVILTPDKKNLFMPAFDIVHDIAISLSPVNQCARVCSITFIPVKIFC